MQHGETNVLLIHCDDEPGLVHKVTGTLFRRRANIVAQGEFVDSTTNRFFMRTAFSGEVDGADLESELRAILPAGSMFRLTRNRKRRIVVLATTEPHCLGDLLIRCAYDDLPAEILAVVSNHPTLRRLAEGFGHPFHEVPHAEKNRDAHEAEVLAVLEPYQPDYLVMAKYMRILTGGFIARFPHRIINIHHSFLPAFVGANPYRQAYERGVKIIGATAHFATELLDEGPIIAQGVVPVDHSQSPAAMAQAGHDVEKTVLARALRLVFEDRVFVHGNKTVIFD
jgi:formyltetrahydrofolate deformylase